MENERRKQYCPNHDPIYICRQGDTLICVAYDCKWQAPARRKEDANVLTVGQLKKVYNE